MRVTAKIRRVYRTRLRTPTLCIVSAMETPESPVEARLIDAAQKAAVPALSMRKAAQMAGLSEGRWRQIVKGFQGTGTGRLPVIAPDETLARMALVVGVTDSQLETAGRPDAAEVLRHLLAASERPDVELEQVSTDRLLGEIRRRIEGASHGVEAAQEPDAPGEAAKDKKTPPRGAGRGRGADFTYGGGEVEMRQDDLELASRRGGGKSETRRIREEQDAAAEGGDV